MNSLLRCFKKICGNVAIHGNVSSRQPLQKKVQNYTTILEMTATIQLYERHQTCTSSIKFSSYQNLVTFKNW